jgi:regulatory factor X
MPADTASFPTQEQTLVAHPAISSNHQPLSRGQLFAQPELPGFPHPHDEPKMFTQVIKFSPSAHVVNPDESMMLPDIGQFVPAGTDADLANALFALYRTHCTSLVDSIRFCRQKAFFRHLASFNGTLTVPVTKLFASQSIAEWINRCDWLMYQQIVRFMSHLALQVIPQPVFNLLTEISNSLTDTIRKNFSQHPHHVLQAKLGPATVFASLLTRLLRVNESAHAAATFLTNDAVRTLMWQDWAEFVRPKRVCESELPNCGYEEVFNILTFGIRQLLEPVDGHAVPRPIGASFQSVVAAATLAPPALPTDAAILDRWSTFLRTLPDRFPNTSTRTVLHTINAVGSAALRDITVAQAQSFGSWWITKVWVDEMMLWLAEMGGFLEGQQSISISPPELGQSQSSAASGESSGSGAGAQDTSGLGLAFPADLSSSVSGPLMKSGAGNTNTNINNAGMYNTS